MMKGRPYPFANTINGEETTPGLTPLEGNTGDGRSEASKMVSTPLTLPFVNDLT